MTLPLRLLFALLACALACALGCSSSTEGAPLSLANNWFYASADGSGGVAIDIHADHTYVSAILAATSATSFDAQTETGTVAVSGATLTFTPTAWSCLEPTDPPYSASFSISGNALTVGFPTGLLVLQHNTTPADAAPGGVTLRNGCFLGNGAFAPSPLTAVGTCASVGAACSDAALCCNGAACTNGGHCSAICTSNSNCQSGCCPAAASAATVRVCAPAADCP